MRQRTDETAAIAAYWHFMKATNMPSTQWSAKRKRQYQHIKDSVLARGQNEPLAEEIAARTANKERAQHGESMAASAVASGRTRAPVGAP